MKILVAYFSCSHVTEHVAQMIAKATKGDLFEIKPTIPYTKDDLNWNNKNSRSSIEMKNYSSRPEIANKVKTMDHYDIVFIGFPIWWYVAPTIINTFLESYDFSEKTIVPFATSGGSGAGKTDQYLQVSCPNIHRWYPTTLFNGNPHQERIEKWVQSLHL